MIDAIEFMGRTLFEGRTPADGDAAISIGDPGQPEPALLSRFPHGLRILFADVQPDSADRHGVPPGDCLHPSGAARIAAFVRPLRQKARYAYAHVVRLLADALGVRVELPERSEIPVVGRVLSVWD